MTTFVSRVGMQTFRAVIAIAGMSALSLAAVSTASAAPPSPSPSVVLSVHGDSTDYVTQGGNSVISTGISADTVTASELSTSEVSVGGSGPGSPSLSFDLIIPYGDSLRPGQYGSLADTQAAGVRVGTGLDTQVTFANRRCDSGQSGAVTIQDVASSGTTITRLDLLFDLHCAYSSAAAFGELRINEPQPTNQPAMSPGFVVSDGNVRWPDTDPGASAAPISVSVTNTSATPLEFSDLPHQYGPDQQAFPVIGDTCNDGAVAPGANCTVTVMFEPGGAGVARAELHLYAGDYDIMINLVGVSTDGATELDLDGSPGDPLLDGDTVTSTNENDGPLSVYGGATSIYFTTGSYIRATFAAHQAGTFGPGTYPVSNQPDAEYDFDLGYGGSSCNTYTGVVTVREIVADPLDGSLARFDAAFRVLCDGQSEPITGRIRYNATTPDVDPVVIAPASHPIAYGGLVTVHGHATPNAPVTVLSVQRGRRTYQTLATTTAGTDGTFSASYRANDDYCFAAQQPATRHSVRMVQSAGVAYRITPTISEHGTIRPRRNSTIMLSGTANPHRGLEMVEHPIGKRAATITRTVRVTAGGHWTLRLTASESIRTYFVTSTVHTVSATLIIRPR